MNRMNDNAAALFFDCCVRTMSSPPTTLTLPPGPAGTPAVASRKLGCALAKIAQHPRAVENRRVLALGEPVLGAEVAP